MSTSIWIVKAEGGCSSYDLHSYNLGVFSTNEKAKEFVLSLKPDVDTKEPFYDEWEEDEEVRVIEIDDFFLHLYIREFELDEPDEDSNEVINELLNLQRW